MPFSQRRQAIHVVCPVCDWTKAVLAYENARKRCFLCPHCQHVWDTTETAPEERARLTRRTAELREQLEVLKKRPFDPGEHAEHKTPLRRHLDNRRDRRRT